MDFTSFPSVLATLGVLGMFVAVITNIWRFGNIDLTGRFANMRGVFGRAIVVGVVLAALLRANIVDMLQNPDGPALMLGWLTLPWGDYASAGEKAVAIVEEAFGILVTGVVLAFVSKFWNDAFDIVYEFKRWLRGKANSLKPEEGAARPSISVSRSRPRGGRGRGGRGRPSSSGGGGSSSDRRSVGN